MASITPGLLGDVQADPSPFKRLPVVPFFPTSLGNPLLSARISLRVCLYLYWASLLFLLPSPAHLSCNSGASRSPALPFFVSMPLWQELAPVPVRLLESYSESPPPRARPRAGPGKLVRGVASGRLSEGPCALKPRVPRPQ